MAALTVNEILKLVRFYGNKSQKGNAYTPQDFNLNLKNENMQIFNDELAKFQVGMIIPEPLRRFKVSVSAGTLATGVYTLPSDYAELVTNTFTVNIGGVLKYGTIQDNTVARRMISDAAYKLRENPVAVLESGTIKVYPTDATEISLEYLKVPDNPVYDYYIDDNLNEVFLVTGASKVLSGNETGSAGQVAPATVNSLTVELDWDDTIHPRFVSRLIEPMGVNLREADLVQVSQINTQEAR